MQELIKAFGIDWRLIVIQVFNFGVLVGILWYFLYTPVLKMLSDRASKIARGVKDAEDAAEARKNADVEKHRVLEDAHREASDIVKRGTEHAEEKGKELLNEAQERIARELESAKLAAAELKAQAQKESEAEIAKLAILGAERVLRDELSK
ncbi:MAG TPA: F0F1 ATP synthase subunit B [Candidatus Paceibacterota bacterium]|nr:F0F1 ATP synthase subunit B [Candidatus Paceibacterota bacterium]